MTLEPAAQIRFPAGTMLAERYRIVSLVGRGGMGEIYRADDTKLGMEVALKLLPKAMEEHSGRLKRLLAEVKVARQISHSNVCRVYDIVEEDGLHFISMEYLDGENLTHLLRRIGRPQMGKAAEIGQQICYGLAAAHEKGILHRDLKPSNLMIDSEGHAHITDFGLAGLADSFSDQEIRHGTPAYMAPEQHAGHEVTVRSDIYALGLVLYKLFTGRAAFEASSAEELARLHRERPPPPPSRWVKDLDPAVERVILRCLEKDPRDRPASALTVALALPADTTAAEAATVKTLLVRELAGGALLGDRLGDAEARHVRRRHDRLARGLAEEYEGREIDSAGEPCLLFDRPINSVRYALAYHRAVRTLAEEERVELAARVGIHLGEVLLPGDSQSQEPHEPDVDAKSREILSRLLDLTEEHQTLVTRGAFDLARQSSAAEFEQVRWLAHGSYEIAGLSEPLEIFEVGVESVAPLRPPRETDSARRRLVQDTISGWRPAPGLELPQRPHWKIERKIAEGGFGEVWLALHTKTHERRVFKFCYDPERLKGLEREITVFRLLKEELGERPDITRILDWNFREAPYFIESEYTAGGDLVEWSQAEGGLKAVPLEVRLEIVAQVATALAAAHSVGVLHKDVKPANVLMTRDPSGRVVARLNDFGIGLITERERLEEVGITVRGLTDTSRATSTDSSYQGTRLYQAPEVLEGKRPTLQADIYALGVLLYQMVVGDFARALAPGWYREIDDELLAEDIAAAADGLPERRLASAAQLAERLRRLEERRAARAAERREREEAEQAKVALARARVRRKLALAAIGVLAIFAVVISMLYRSAVEAQAWAEREAFTAQQVADFLVELLESSDPFGANPQETRVRDVLDHAAEDIDTLDAEPLVVARLQHTVGRVYRKLEIYDRAEAHLRKALELRTRHLSGDHAEIADSLDALADVVHELERFEEAEALARRGLEMRRRLGEVSDIAASLATLGHIFYHRGRIDDAMVTLRETFRMRREVLENDDLKIAEIARELAKVLRDQHRPEEAEPFYRQSLEIRRQHYDEDHPLVASAKNSLGLDLLQQGRNDEAIQLIREAIASFEIDGPISHLAVAKLNLGRALVAQSQCDEAEPLIRDAQQLLSTEPLYAWRNGVANGLLGECRLQSGELFEAERFLLTSLSELKEKKGEGATETLEAKIRLISLYESWGRPEEIVELRLLDGS